MDKQKTEAKTTKRLRLYVRKRHQEKLHRIKELGCLGKQDVGTLSPRDFFVAGLALYWGEGYKLGSGEVGFTNKDPRAIRFFIRWIQTTYGVTKKDLVGRITINEMYCEQEISIQKYWERATGLPKKAFTKTSFISSVSKVARKNPKTYFGTIRIKVHRSTNLQRRILGSLERLASDRK